MRNRGPLPVIGAAIVIVLALVAGGTALGFGPLAGTTPPSEVTDPRRCSRARLQATLDAQSVHLEGDAERHDPGRARRARRAGRQPRRLDGRGRPPAARREDLDHAHEPRARRRRRRGLGLGRRLVPHRAGRRLAARLARRDVGARQAWTSTRSRSSSGCVPTSRRRASNPTLEEVACASASGRCHRVSVEAGRDPATIIRAMLPTDQAGTLPDVRTTVTLDTDALTLRPAHLVVDATSDDGTIVLHLELDAIAVGRPGDRHRGALGRVLTTAREGPAT